MDFVAWCDLVLRKVIEASRRASTHRSIGVQERDVARILFSPEIVDQPGFYQSPQRTAMMSALSQLQHMDLVERSFGWKVTRAGRDVAIDTLPLWSEICKEQLDQEQQQLLKVINRLSPHTADGYTWLEQVTRETLLSELSWAVDRYLLWSVAQDLQQWGYITGRFYHDGSMDLFATYRSLVWETRRGFTLESRFIDYLVAEWETTSVDFKQELHLDTADEKAEFIKDVLSLVNTQASGRRWLIIGFANRTRTYFGPPDPKVTHDRMEQIIARYIDPSVDIRYEVIEYRAGRIGKLEVIRDPKKLPYRVKEEIKRDRKPPLQAGEIFVRHGSQVEKPTDAELQALQEEGDHARSTDTHFRSVEDGLVQ